MFGLGWPELLLIFVAVLLLFGAKRLPEIAQGLGKGIREFKKSVKETTEDLKGSLEEKADDASASKPKDKSDNNQKQQSK